MVKNGWWEAWYSSLHPALITALIQIIPWDFNGPGLFLAVLWAAVYSGCHLILNKLNSPRILHFVLIPLVFVPAQLASSVIIVRDSYFSAVFLLFIGYIFYFNSINKELKLIDIFYLSLMGSFLMFYRSDAVPPVLIALLIIALIYFKDGRHTQIYLRFFLALAAPIALFYFLSVLPSSLLEKSEVKGNNWGSRTELEYKLTLIENPLGYIVRNNGFITDDQRKKIEKVFKIKDLRDKSSPDNLSLFYGGLWNKMSSKKDRDSAFNASLAVFYQNPRLFILSKNETLSTVGEKNTQTVCSSSLMNDRGFPRALSGRLIGLTGDGILNIIRNTETDQGLWGGKKVWWNVYFSIFTLMVIVVFFKITFAASLISLILLIRTAVVFLFAPAGFTVYYTTLLLGAPLIFIFWIGEIILAWREKKR
jgi:hypothetical protein